MTTDNKRSNKPLWWKFVPTGHKIYQFQVPWVSNLELDKQEKNKRKNRDFDRSSRRKWGMTDVVKVKMQKSGIASQKVARRGVSCHERILVGPSSWGAREQKVWLTDRIYGGAGRIKACENPIHSRFEFLGTFSELISRWWEFPGGWVSAAVVGTKKKKLLH